MFSRSLMPLAGKIMRLQSFILCIACLTLSSVYAVAGPAASGGPQIAPNDSTSVSTYKVTDTSVGASARESAGTSSLPSSGSSSTNASSTNSSSSDGAASSNRSVPSAFGTAPRATNDSTEVATEIKREKVIDTGDKAVERDESAKAASSDKTF